MTRHALRLGSLPSTLNYDLSAVVTVAHTIPVCSTTGDAVGTCLVLAGTGRVASTWLLLQLLFCRGALLHAIPGLNRQSQQHPRSPSHHLFTSLHNTSRVDSNGFAIDRSACPRPAQNKGSVLGARDKARKLHCCSFWYELAAAEAAAAADPKWLATRHQ